MVGGTTRLVVHEVDCLCRDKEEGVSKGIGAYGIGNVGGCGEWPRGVAGSFPKRLRRVASVRGVTVGAIGLRAAGGGVVGVLVGSSAGVAEGVWLRGTGEPIGPGPGAGATGAMTCGRSACWSLVAFDVFWRSAALLGSACGVMWNLRPLEAGVRWPTVAAATVIGRERILLLGRRLSRWLSSLACSVWLLGSSDMFLRVFMYKFRKWK